MWHWHSFAQKWKNNVAEFVRARDREAKEEMRERATEYVPKGYSLIQAFTNGKEIVIPDQTYLRISDDHNCDQMGCGSLDHVFARFALPLDPPAEDRACEGIAPQDGEPCALPLNHSGPHSHIGPYRNRRPAERQTYKMDGYPRREH